METGDKVINAVVLSITENKYCLVIETLDTLGESSFLKLHGNEELKNLDLDFIKLSEVVVSAQHLETKDLHFAFKKDNQILTWKVSVLTQDIN